MMLKRALFVAVALALPTAVFAQSADDVAYCKALSAKYREVNRGNDPQGAGATAMAACDTNPGAGIPFLEKSLTDAKMPLPPRPMASSFNPKAYTNTAECLTAAYAAKAPLNLCK